MEQSTGAGRLKIYRKRFIPEENILLKDDAVLLCEPETLITRWETLKPKNDFKYGFSAYYPNAGYKISKVYTQDKTYKHTYIDIIRAEIDAKAGVCVFADMLVDILIKPDGGVFVLDLNELAAAYEKHLITLADLLSALKVTDALLKTVYSGNLHTLTAKLREYIPSDFTGNES